MAARARNNPRTPRLLEAIGAALNALPGVFSTVQWGGRAYKLPGPGGNRKKPKLLAHVYVIEESGSIGVDFKLAKDRADEVIDQYQWIEPHSFRTLAPSGWISAEVSGERQLNVLKQLLRESHAMLSRKSGGQPEETKSSRRDAVAQRLDSVLREKKAQGWSPRDDFDLS